jgi:hypothetical protein
VTHLGPVGAGIGLAEAPLAAGLAEAPLAAGLAEVPLADGLDPPVELLLLGDEQPAATTMAADTAARTQIRFGVTSKLPFSW